MARDTWFLTWPILATLSANRSHPPLGRARPDPPEINSRTLPDIHRALKRTGERAARNAEGTIQLRGTSSGAGQTSNAPKASLYTSTCSRRGRTRQTPGFRITPSEFKPSWTSHDASTDTSQQWESGCGGPSKMPPSVKKRDPRSSPYHESTPEGQSALAQH